MSISRVLRRISSTSRLLNRKTVPRIYIYKDEFVGSHQYVSQTGPCLSLRRSGSTSGGGCQISEALDRSRRRPDGGRGRADKFPRRDAYLASPACNTVSAMFLASRITSGLFITNSACVATVVGLRCPSGVVASPKSNKRVERRQIGSPQRQVDAAAIGLFRIHADAAGAGFAVGADAGVERAAHRQIQIAAHGEIGVADFLNAEALPRKVRKQTIFRVLRFGRFIVDRAHLVSLREHDQCGSSS